MKKKYNSEMSVKTLSKGIKEVCNILRRGKAKGAMNYIPELSWMLFLRFLDILEINKEKEFLSVDRKYEPILQKPYRWRDWAHYYETTDQKTNANKFSIGWKRKDIDIQGKNTLIDFVNNDLFNYLSQLKKSKKSYHKVIGLIFSLKKQTILKYDTNLKDALDKITKITSSDFDTTHMFPLSQAYEQLLPSLGEKGSDGGQFFTPREVVRVIIDVVNPDLDKTIFDPCCGTGGFFAESYKKLLQKNPSPKQLSFIKNQAFWGIEDSDDTIILLLANLILHEIEVPHILHGNTLTGSVDFGELYENNPVTYDYILTNPPFGSKEGKAAQARFPYKCAKAQILFLQDIIDKLKSGGTCGMVIDDGVLFHNKTKAFVQTKKKLLNECNLFCIVSLPQKTFVNVNAGSKTNLLFFKKGTATKKVWYYDMEIDKDNKLRNVTKGNPLKFEEFNDFFYRFKLPENHKERISGRSWYLTLEEIKENNYVMHAKNKNKNSENILKDSSSYLKEISSSQKKINKLLKDLLI